MICSGISAGTERANLKALPNSKAGSRGGFPYNPGYSGVGVVTKSASAQVRVGDLVALRSKHQSVWAGKAENLIKVPEGLDMEAAAFWFVGVIALQAVKRIDPRPQQTERRLRALVVGAVSSPG